MNEKTISVLRTFPIISTYPPTDDCAQKLLKNRTMIENEFNATRNAASLRSIFKKIGAGVHIQAPFYFDVGVNTSIGQNVHFGPGTVILDAGEVTIGDDTKIGKNVIIASVTHDVADRERHLSDIKYRIKIGPHVTLGDQAIIFPNITIGAGAIIEKGALVHQHVPAGETVKSQNTTGTLMTSIELGRFQRIPATQHIDPGFKKFGGNIELRSGLHFRHPSNISLENGVYVNACCLFDGSGGDIHLQENVALAPRVQLLTTIPNQSGQLQTGPIKIEKNVWLAAGVIVLPGVHVGAFSVVGAGTIVDRDIPAETLAFGDLSRPGNMRRIHFK